MNVGVSGGPNGQIQPHITITGRGTASVVPDIARISMGIEVEAQTAREASTRCAEAMRRVLDALSAQGVQGRDVRTSHLAIMPQYEHTPEGNRRRVGHSASNTVLATLRATDRVGIVLDAVIDAGGDEVTIQNIELTASDTSAAQIEARHAALADARTQAQDIASQMGLHLGQPLAIEMGAGGTPFPPPRHAAFSLAHAAAQPVEAGEIEVHAEVEVVFAIYAMLPGSAQSAPGAEWKRRR